MTVCSQVAELAVNKKQPAEMRFMKSSAPLNVTPTSPGSANTLFRERLEPTRQEESHWCIASLSSHSQLARNQNSDLNMQHQKLRSSVEGLTHQVQTLKYLSKMGDADYLRAETLTHIPKAARSKSFFNVRHWFQIRMRNGFFLM